MKKCATVCAFIIALATFANSITVEQQERFFSYKTPSAGSAPDTTWLSASGLGTTRNNFGGEVGCKFTANNTVTLTSLGSWVISGSTQTHQIGIWDSTDQVNPIALVSINKNGLSVGFHTVAVSTPTNLISGHIYYIGEEQFSGGDAFYNDDQVTVSTTAIGTISTSTFHTGTFGCPNSTSTAGVHAFGPPNFLYH